jgi:hypothetical protein
MIRYIVISVLTLTLIMVSLFIVGCETQGQSGALIGTGVGAGVGALATRGSAAGTLVGAAVGGGAGYIIGNEGDKKQQQQQMQNTQEQANSILVNIHNSNGSISTVRLMRSGTGYVGPRNEFYDHLPTEAELRPVYGF